jgi:hypothetical protein
MKRPRSATGNDTPRLLIPTRRGLPPVVTCRGTKPSHAAKSRPRAKLSPWPMAAISAVAFNALPLIPQSDSPDLSGRDFLPMFFPCSRLPRIRQPALIEAVFDPGTGPE